MKNVKLIDLTGQRFGKLVVLNRTEDYIFKSGRKERMWHCQCDCGNIIDVIGTNLKNNNTISCGCFRREKMKNLKTTHGLSHSRLHLIYRNIKSRCYNPNDKKFKNYGGRGITICDEWLGDNGFINFYNWAVTHGYLENLTIDRIETNGNYEPNNCRWTDFTVQANNRTNNHLITYNSKTMTIANWAKEFGINYKTLSNRILQGWSIDRAFTTPVRYNAKKNESEELKNAG